MLSNCSLIKINEQCRLYIYFQKLVYVFRVVFHVICDLVFFLGTAHRPREHVRTTIRLRKFMHVYIYLFILDYRIISCKFKELFINLNIYTRIKYDLTLSYVLPVLQ